MAQDLSALGRKWDNRASPVESFRIIFVGGVPRSSATGVIGGAADAAANKRDVAVAALRATLVSSTVAAAAAAKPNFNALLLFG